MQAISIDAPIAGWDSFNSLDNMDPLSAVILDNLIPGTGKVVTRQGHIVYADLGTGKPVETIASLNSSDKTALVAGSDGGLFDITDPTNIVTLTATGTYTNDRWNEQNFRKADEAGVLILTNGVDPAVAYNGTSLAPIVDTLTVGTEFIGCELFKGRMYYWKDNDDAFYYTDAGAYQGNLTRFPLGAFANKGGKLIMVTTWTQQDSGDGKDDFLVFVFSTGEILIYQGDDPGGVGFFEMVGRYNTAQPMSVRGRDKYGSDVVIMTQDGYVGLSSVIQQGRTSDVPQFSRLIHDAITTRTASSSNLWGWDCCLVQKRGLFVFNVPLSDLSFEQHVMNTVTQRWCRFTNINVNCINTHDDRFFGGAQDGRVFAILESTADLGNPIEFTALPAFNGLGDNGNQKHITAAQVLTTHSKPEYIEMRGYADYDVPILGPLQVPAGSTEGAWSPEPATPAQAQGSFWDVDYWAKGGSQSTYKGWQNVSAFGYAVTIIVRFAKVNEGVVWRSTNYRYYNAGSN